MDVWVWVYVCMCSCMWACVLGCCVFDLEWVLNLGAGSA